MSTPNFVQGMTVTAPSQKKMAGSVDWNKANPEIDYTGTRITLPGDPDKMPLDEAIVALLRLKEDEEQMMNAVEFFDVHPFDGAVAFMKAMKRKYGWASPVPTPGFWQTPPTLLTVETGYAESVQVIWGAFKLPGIENPMQTAAQPKDGRAQFVIHGKLRRREMTVLKELAELTREILKTESIYKGKPIRLKVNHATGRIDQSDPPSFLPTSFIMESDLILNDGEGEQIATSLWTPIRNTAACIRHRIPLKRGILLEGPYGCGKTLTASVTSKICVDNGWTFILLDNVLSLKEALLFAQRYQPAVVFAEDIDRLADERDEAGNDLLNTIDGVLSKNSQVITVLTTNFVEKIDPAMLRPGRFDAVISIRPPDAKSVVKLVHGYGRGLINANEDLTTLGSVLAGKIPAAVREAVERAKLGMIARGDNTINQDDLLVSARGMAAHLALLEPKVTVKSKAEVLAVALQEVIFNGHGEMIERTKENTEYIRRNI